MINELCYAGATRSAEDDTIADVAQAGSRGMLPISSIAVLWKDSVSHNRDFLVVAIGVPPILFAEMSLVF